MNRPFIHDDFLLDNEFARELYHRHAAPQPILDFHTHFSPALIATNHQFADLTEMWISCDHYKTRVMRTNGVAERFMGGDASPKEKYLAWAGAVPYTFRNPIHHWSHLELARTFGISQLLNPDTADAIWDAANARIPSLRVHDLLRLHQVDTICTTDDPIDSLEPHLAARRSGMKTKLYPVYRPDKALEIRNPAAFVWWLHRLEEAALMTIRTLDDFLQALKKRHDDFHAIGCRLSDHGLERCHAVACSHARASRIFRSVLAGRFCTPEENDAYASFLMLEFGRWDAARGWTKQLHLGALRSATGFVAPPDDPIRFMKRLFGRWEWGRAMAKKLYRSAVPARENTSRGTRRLHPVFGAVGDFPQAQALAAYLNALDKTGQLPRMIIYNINPADNYLIASMLGNFQDGAIAGKVRMGSGWWFLDHKEGLEWQLNALSNLSLLRHFVGMVSDGGSFLSASRHEYFRRVLCNLLGREMASGELPDDLPLIGTMVGEICYKNARDYLRLGGEAPESINASR